MLENLDGVPNRADPFLWADFVELRRPVVGHWRRRRGRACPQALDHRPRPFVRIVDITGKGLDHGRNALQRSCPLAAALPHGRQAANVVFNLVEAVGKAGDSTSRSVVHSSNGSD